MIIFALFLFVSASDSFAYPSHWWKKIAENERQGSWEVLPHEVLKNKVLVLSKRNELGVFSNFANTPFELDKKEYASIEALWQMMKYPDLSDPNDPRNSIKHLFKLTREDVSKLSGFEAKKVGDIANKINEKYNLKNILSYKKRIFNYKDFSEGSLYHYQIIKKAIELKVLSHPDIYKLLLTTKGLKLVPDHIQGDNLPKSYLYHEILMDIRDSKPAK